MMTVEIETDNGSKVVEDGKVIDSNPNAEKHVDTTGRKPAPKIDIPDRHKDLRASQLADLNKKDDGYEYSYARSDVTEWDLEWKEAELVKDKNGRKLHFRGDPVIRRKKDRQQAIRLQAELESEGMLKDVVKSSDTRQFAKAKSPTKT